MTNDDEERDPLLVRPYLRGAGEPADDRSTQTWPSATTREVRSHRALEGVDDPTAVLHLLQAPQPARRGRHRLLLVIVACAAVLLGAAAAGFATLRTTGHPGTSAALPDAPIPALSGLVPASPAAPPGRASTAHSAATSAGHRRTTTAPSSAARTATTATTAPDAPVVATDDDGKTASPPAGLAPPVPTARTGTIRGQNGLCLDLNGAVAVDFNHIQVFDCNGTAAQNWTLATDGTLRVLGKCALVVGDNTVHIVTCDGRTTAQWRVSGQQLINSSDQQCLTDPSSGTTSGTGVTVTACNGRANQRWSLP